MKSAVVPTIACMFTFPIPISLKNQIRVPLKEHKGESMRGCRPRSNRYLSTKSFQIVNYSLSEDASRFAIVQLRHPRDSVPLIVVQLREQLKRNAYDLRQSL